MTQLYCAKHAMAPARSFREQFIPFAIFGLNL